MSENHTKSDGQKFFYKVNVEAIRGGLIAEIGFDGWATLSAIASFMNERGECFPTQDTLAKMLGVTRQTVNKKIGALTDTTLKDGRPLLEKRLFNSGMGTRAFYTIHQLSGVSFGRGIVNEINSNVNDGLTANVNDGLHKEEPYKQEPLFKEELKGFALTAKDVVNYFCKKYNDKYGVKYTPNYARDCSMIKSKLLKNYDAETIQAIIDVVFEEYDNRWKKGQYPRPSIGQLCSWLANEALAVVEERKKEDAATDEAIADGDHYFNDDFENKLLEALGGASQNEENK